MGDIDKLMRELKADSDEFDRLIRLAKAQIAAENYHAVDPILQEIYRIRPHLGIKFGYRRWLPSND